jgi:dolichol-phosphate mannosyltransferase
VLISLVIPLCDEQPTLRELHDRIVGVAERHQYDLEIVFVDDGSTDDSWNEICQLAEEDSRVRGIRFRKNFGKAAGLTAGFAAARGDVVITLDADLQDDPQEIPRFLAELDDGYDMVSGWKQVRHDPWHKVLPSRVFNAMIGWLTGVRLHDHNCGMKAYRRQVLQEVAFQGGLYRFITVLAAARGFKVGEIVVEHHPRQFGRSKYGISRFFFGLVDLVTVWFRLQFGEKPQYLFASLGMIFAAWSALLLLVGWRWGGLFCGMLAVLFVSIGLVAELVVAQNAQRQLADRSGGAVTSYAIAETVGDFATTNHVTF